VKKKLRPGKQAIEPRARTLKDHLLAMPPVGEDADFERVSDFGRDVKL
jgi:hypothetical protein